MQLQIEIGFERRAEHIYEREREEQRGDEKHDERYRLFPAHNPFGFIEFVLLWFNAFYFAIAGYDRNALVLQSGFRIFSGQAFFQKTFIPEIFFAGFADIASFALFGGAFSLHRAENHNDDTENNRAGADISRLLGKSQPAR